MAPFVHRLRVRYGECDPQGWVFNANYLAYFDVALTELWRVAIGPYGAMVEQGVDMVVAEARLRYLGPARFDEELDIALVVRAMGRTSLTTGVAISNATGAVVDGELRHVFIAVEGRRKVEVPPWIRRGLEPYFDAREGERAPPPAPAET
jgi:acyl-CoA thioester hydrolase